MYAQRIARAWQHHLEVAPHARFSSFLSGGLDGGKEWVCRGWVGMCVWLGWVVGERLGAHGPPRDSIVK